MTETNDPRFRDSRNAPPQQPYPPGAYVSPPREGVSRFLGGSPLGVLLRLILLSVVVGIMLAAIGLDPWNIVLSVRRLLTWIYDFGFDAISGLWRYFLLGAVIVVPLWMISRLFNAPRGR